MIEIKKAPQLQAGDIVRMRNAPRDEPFIWMKVIEKHEDGTVTFFRPWMKTERDRQAGYPYIGIEMFRSNRTDLEYEVYR